MTSRARTEYRYEKLTWPEINDAIEMGKVCVVPCGSVEQHGAHLPLDVDSDDVRTDLIKSGVISFNDEQSPFIWNDLFASGPTALISWTSSYSETGVLGEAELATAEKGRQVYEEAVKQLVRFVSWFKDRPKDQRRDLHRRPPTMPMPWGQRSVDRREGPRSH